MYYERSLEIERRLQTVLKLVQSGNYSTPLIAEKLGVSIPTVSRDVTALRGRGHEIRSWRQHDGSWRFKLVRAASSRKAGVDARTARRA